MISIKQRIFTKYSRFIIWTFSCVISIAALGNLLDSATGMASAKDPNAKAPMVAQKSDKSIRLSLPVIDPKRGRELFVAKGCVLCHSVNGVGGRAGPPLDQLSEGEYIDILDFSARMWRGAFAMIELQGMELGYQLEFTGDELGNIIGFLYSETATSRFNEDNVPDLIKDMFIREPYELEKGLKVDPR